MTNNIIIVIYLITLLFRSVSLFKGSQRLVTVLNKLHHALIIIITIINKDANNCGVCDLDCMF